MATQNHHTEYIISQQAFDSIHAQLPERGADGQTTQSIPVTAKQYRLNVSNTVHAGKWSMWAISQESFEFTWRNGAWHPPHNLVVLSGSGR